MEAVFSLMKLNRGYTVLPFGLDIQPLSPLLWQLNGCTKYFIIPVAVCVMQLRISNQPLHIQAWRHHLVIIRGTQRQIAEWQQ
jgi:hypothetical protein